MLFSCKIIAFAGILGRVRLAPPTVSRVCLLATTKAGETSVHNPGPFAYAGLQSASRPARFPPPPAAHFRLFLGNLDVLAIRPPEEEPLAARAKDVGVLCDAVSLYLIARRYDLLARL